VTTWTKSLSAYRGDKSHHDHVVAVIQEHGKPDLRLVLYRHAMRDEAEFMALDMMLLAHPILERAARVHGEQQ
jgi:hypothetical protein